MKQKKKYVLLGAGGHAKVVLASALANGFSLLGVCDPVISQQGSKLWNNISVLGDDTILNHLNQNNIFLLNGIGLIPNASLRCELQERCEEAGFYFPPLIHPTAWIAPDVQLGAGVQVMAGAVVQPGCLIGSGSIINTGAKVDHDCNIGRYVHIAPSATLCGEINVGDRAFIGASATIINGLSLGNDTFVKAGKLQKSNLTGAEYSIR